MLCGRLPPPPPPPPPAPPPPPPTKICLDNSAKFTYTPPPYSKRSSAAPEPKN